MGEDGQPEAESAEALADLFCRGARRRVRESFRAMWSNDDRFKTAIGRRLLDGDFAWFEQGTVGLGAPAILAGFERDRRESERPSKTTAAAS